ncbi:hypothetical protein SAMN05421737_105154 [Shouchella lonarensis]|uniref:Uncharacterized protein n=1 Tax=Shouchella lonarensis TaxID=1464122 RepID=A0A1G6IUN8_9BACI|nr:hypothetical protein SAMN05421737_105154 [Shouchella lonarensis]
MPPFIRAYWHLQSEDAAGLAAPFLSPNCEAPTMISRMKSTTIKANPLPPPLPYPDPAQGSQY